MRKHPGIGAQGRTWRNIDTSSLKLIMGDILRDSNSITATIDIDISRNQSDIALVKACMINDSSYVEENPIYHEEFGEFIKIAKGSKKYKLRVSFNNTGFFW